MKHREIKADLHKNLSSLDSATACMCGCVCTRVIPVLKLEHSSPCFVHKIVSNKSTSFFTYKKYTVTLPVSKSTPSDS